MFLNLKYFHEDEFRCKHCGSLRMIESFLLKLDIARELSKVPYRITSGYRCKEHNKAVGGLEDSSHLKGCAVDIFTGVNSRMRFKVLLGLFVAGFRRMKVYPEFIHVDSNPYKDADVLALS